MPDNHSPDPDNMVPADQQTAPEKADALIPGYYLGEHAFAAPCVFHYDPPRSGRPRWWRADQDGEGPDPRGCGYTLYSVPALIAAARERDALRAELEKAKGYAKRLAGLLKEVRCDPGADCPACDYGRLRRRVDGAPADHYVGCLYARIDEALAGREGEG